MITLHASFLLYHQLHAVVYNCEYLLGGGLFVFYDS